METFLHQLLSGLATGGVYASLALALVMIYQATHLVNFAQGELAMFSTYLAWAMISAGLPYWVAFVATLAISFACGAAIERVVIRPMKHAPVLSVVIVFIALLLIFNSLAGFLFGPDIQSFPSPFGALVPLQSPYINAHQLGVLLVTLLVVLALFLFFRFTSLGLALRAVAVNPESSRLVGIRVGSMLALGWGLSAAIGAIAGMMIAPIVFLEPNMMAGVQLYAFAAALLGGIDSPAGAVVGGLLVGVLENLLGAYLIGTELKLSVALLLIVLVLVIRPSGLLGKVHVARV
ncbi:MAG: branched-chain amino acid transporter permease [Myxococcaceae bacterium]|nr:branched-chain amino acid transporter permease [Myxococcaceae bacterium]